MLPVRPGGLLSALEAAPDADLVVMGHRGFGDFGSFRDIFANAPFRAGVQVRVWRVARQDLPADDDLLEAIDDLWLDMDRWIASADTTATLAP